MLALTDPKWRELKGNYGNGSQIAELELRYLFAALAAFNGYPWLAKRLETLAVDMEGHE